MPENKFLVFTNKYRGIPWVVLIILSLFLLYQGIQLFNFPQTDVLDKTEREWLAVHGPIRLAANPDLPPIDYFDENGNYAGMVSDLLKIMSKRAGFLYVIVHYPTLEQAVDALKSGEVDALTDIQYSTDLREYVNFSAPTWDIPTVIVANNLQENEIDLQNSNKLSVAIVQGNAQDLTSIKDNPSINKVNAKNALDALQKVSLNQADATILNQAVALYLIEQNGIVNVHIAGELLSGSPLSFGVQKDKEVALTILENALMTVSKEERNEIYKKWIAFSPGTSANTYEFKVLTFWFLFSVAIILALALFLTNLLRIQVNARTSDLKNELQVRLKAEKQLSQQLNNLSALRAVGGAINASMDLNLTLSILLDQVVSKLDVDACDVLLLNPYTRTLDFAAGRGFSTQLINRSSLKSNLSYAWRVINQRQLLFIENISADSNNFISPEFIESEKFISYIGAPLIAKKVTNGVLEIFHHSPLDRDRNWFDYLDAMADQAAIAIDNATMFQDLQRANTDLTLAYDKTIEGWAKALELRDGATEGHSQRVMKLTLHLASKLGMDEDDLIKVRHGALLHDIGKMGIPDSILLKPGPLTDDEWIIMKKHPEYAFQMLKDVAYLRAAIDIPHYHHEHWDGSGYPNGLRGEQIPLSARIFSVIDVWDALTSERPYRKAWTTRKTLTYIRENSGKQFDPKIVDLFLEMEKE